MMVPNIARPSKTLTIVRDYRGNTYYFSYDTLIAVKVNTGGKQETIARKNVWGTQTGKHINEADGGEKAAKSKRLDERAFEGALMNLLAAQARSA